MLILKHRSVIRLIIIWIFILNLTNAQNDLPQPSNYLLQLRIDSQNILKISNIEINSILKLAKRNIQLNVENSNKTESILLKKNDIVDDNTSFYMNTKRIDYDIPFIYTGKGKLLPGYDTLNVLLLITNKEILIKAFNGSIGFLSEKVQDINNTYRLVEDNRQQFEQTETFKCNTLTNEKPGCNECGEKKVFKMNKGISSSFLQNVNRAGNISDTITVRLALELEPNYITREVPGDTLSINVQKAINEALLITSSVNDIYLNEAKIKFNVSAIRVWKDYTNHPWSFYPTFHILEAFRAFYAKHDFKPSVDDRDITYIFEYGYSGAEGGISGEGNLVMPCEKDRAFSWGSMLGWRDTFIMAHELGHNFGLRHTHDCVWTINKTQISSFDSCSTKGNCSGSVQVRRDGTIMSYCTNYGLKFHDETRKLLRSNGEICFTNFISNKINISGYFNLPEINLSGNKIEFYLFRDIGQLVNKHFFAAISDSNRFTVEIPVSEIYVRPRVFGYYFPEEKSFYATQNFEGIRFSKVETPKPPELLFPSNNNEVSINPTFNWYDEYDASSYKLQIALDSSFQNIVYQDEFIKHDSTGFYEFYNSDYIFTEYSLTEQLPYLTKYYLRVKSVNFIGEGEWSKTYNFVVGITSVNTGNNLEDNEGKLIVSNYPNPFNEQTNISFYLPRSTSVKIILYDITGRKHSEYSLDNHLNSGLHHFALNLRSSSTGIYFYELLTEYGNAYGKLNFIK